MSESKIGRRQRERIAARAGYCCSYCLSSQAITGTAMQIDHVQPESRGGTSDDDNLCWCCGECNTYKGDLIAALDPLSRIEVPLFHPTHQHWAEHFVWVEEGVRIEGLTATGRAMVEALRLNRPWLVMPGSDGLPSAGIPHMKKRSLIFLFAVE